MDQPPQIEHAEAQESSVPAAAGAEFMNAIPAGPIAAVSSACVTSDPEYLPAGHAMLSCLTAPSGSATMPYVVLTSPKSAVALETAEVASLLNVHAN
jgi:hypothetical protein